jgi:hypothetical protein
MGNFDVIIIIIYIESFVEFFNYCLAHRGKKS